MSGIVEVFELCALGIRHNMVSIGMFDMWKLQIALLPSYDRSMVAQW